MIIFPLPDWLISMPDGREKDRAITRFYIRLACVYASPQCSTPKLAELIGISYPALRAQITSRDQRGATKETREGILRLLGPSFVPPQIADRRFKANR